MSLATIGKPLRLYEITSGLMFVEAMLVESEGELTPEIEAELDHLEIELPTKVDAIAEMIAQANAEEAFFDAELKRLQARKRVAASRAVSLKNYLLGNLQRIGHSEVKGPRYTIRVQRNSVPAITWTRPMEDLPVAFLKAVPTVDTEAARAAFKAGTLPDGFEASIGSHVRIS